jgi:hypothetical protein
MTKQEKHALRKIIESCGHPCAPGAAYDENFRPVKVEELVPGTPNHKLLDSELYKAGYRYAHRQLADYLAFLMTATRKELVRFAGKAV